MEDADDMKALALLVFIKSHNGASVVSNYSTYKMSKLTGLHKQTIKKRMNTLGAMDLIDFVGKRCSHVIFKKVRAVKSNVDISKIDKSSVRNIEIGLRALVLVEIQRQKEFVKQIFFKATDPKPFTPQKEVRKSKKFCNHRGIEHFNDNGISYKTLAKRMHTGLNQVSQAIKYGEKHNMFIKHRHIELIYRNIYNAKRFVSVRNINNCFINKYNNCIYSYSCNTYSFPML